MKKKIKVLLILVIGLSVSSFSQSLLKVGITYTIGKEQSIIGKKKDKHHEKNVLSSFGSGLTIDVGYAYLTDSFYGPEATFSFFVGKPKTIEHIVAENFETETIIKRKLLFFSPSLLLVGNSNGNINPYLSSGLLLNLWGSVIKTEIIKTEEAKSIEKNWKVNYNKGIGYKSKIGILYGNDETIKPYFELQYQMLSIGYNSEELLSYKIEGKDELSGLSLSDKKHVYVTAFDHESNIKSNAHFDVNKPTSVLLNYANHNHFGANIGSFFVFN